MKSLIRHSGNSVEEELFLCSEEEYQKYKERFKSMRESYYTTLSIDKEIKITPRTQVSDGYYWRSKVECECTAVGICEKSAGGSYYKKYYTTEDRIKSYKNKGYEEGWC